MNEFGMEVMHDVVSRHPGKQLQFGQTGVGRWQCDQFAHIVKRGMLLALHQLEYHTFAGVHEATDLL